MGFTAKDAIRIFKATRKRVPLVDLLLAPLARMSISKPELPRKARRSA